MVFPPSHISDYSGSLGPLSTFKSSFSTFWVLFIGELENFSLFLARTKYALKVWKKWMFGAEFTRKRPSFYPEFYSQWSAHRGHFHSNERGKICRKYIKGPLCEGYGHLSWFQCGISVEITKRLKILVDFSLNDVLKSILKNSQQPQRTDKVVPSQ